MLRHSFYLILILCGFLSHAQDNTVFITSTEEPKKKEGDKSNFLQDFAPLSQFALSVPFRSNPEYGQNNDSDSNNDWFIPDGISAHAGFGVHVFETLAFTANTGVDWQITPKLVSVPVYGSILLIPSITDDSSILIQAGLGKAFAIGRGNLSGIYQKYRLGYTDDNTVFFAEINFYGYPWEDVKQMGTINLGVCLLNFE